MAEVDPFALLADIGSTASSNAIFPLPEAEQLKYNKIQEEMAANKIKQAELEATAQKWDRLAALAGGVGQGLNPFSDEMIAGARSLAQGVPYLSSLLDAKPYAEAIKEEQDLVKRAEAANPTAFKVGQYGSILGSALSTGLLSSAAQAPKYLPTVTRAIESIPGVSTVLGTKAATTLPSLIRGGAATGAIQGAGSAEAGLENRLTGGIIGGGIGAVATPTLYFGGKALVQGAGDLAAKYGLDLSALGSKLKQAFSSETGGVGDIPANKAAWAPDVNVTFEKPSPAAFEAARQLRNVRPEELTAAQALAAEAERLKLPLFLPEAVGTGGIKQSAQVVAQRPESIDIAKRAIEGRAKQQLDRLSGVFDEVSPEVSSYRGGYRMAEAAQSIVEGLESERAALAKPLYDKAREEAPDIVNESLNNLISKDKNLSSAIKEVKSFGANADKSSTSLDVLDQAKRILDDKIRKAKKDGAVNKAKLIEDTKNQLVSHLDEASPTYKEARAAFEDASKGLNELEKTKFKMLMDIDPADTQKIGTIFRYEPEQILSLRKSFEDAGKLADFEAGIRGFMQKSIESKKPGFDLASQFTTPAMKKKLEAALGDKSERIIKALDIEEKIAQGKRDYLGGSTTRSQLKAEQDLEEASSAAKDIVKREGWTSKAMGLLSKALIEKPDEKFYQDLANIYFSPRASENLSGLTPLVRALQASQAAGEVAGTVAQQGARRIAGRLDNERPSSTAPSKSGLAVGGIGIGSASDIDQLLADINSGVTEPVVESKPVLPENPTKADYESLIEKTAMKYGVPAEFAKAVAASESSFNPRAKSNKGALGLFQLMPGTAKDLGVDPLNPVQNIDGGIRYLAQQLKKFDGDQKLAAAAFNWGPARVARAVNKANKQGIDPTWENILDVSWTPNETQKYVSKVLTKANQYRA